METVENNAKQEHQDSVYQQEIDSDTDPESVIRSG